MTDVVVRPMRWTDIPSVHTIETGAFPQTAWSVEAFWSELAGVPDTRWYAVAVISGRVVGYAGLMAAAAEADVQTIAVDDSHRRRGVGALLLDAVLREAEARGCSSVLLEVDAGNEAAQRLYEGRGFEPIARRRNYYGPGLDALVMRRVMRRRLRSGVDA